MSVTSEKPIGEERRYTNTEMAKKIVKKKLIVPWGILVLIFITTGILCDIVYRRVSGEMTLARFSDSALAFGFWSCVLLLYMERKSVGGDRWKNRLRIGGWLLLAFGMLFGFLSMYLYFL